MTRKPKKRKLRENRCICFRFHFAGSKAEKKCNADYRNRDYDSSVGD
jgi:hypothetical protein